MYVHPFHLNLSNFERHFISRGEMYSGTFFMVMDLLKQRVVLTHSFTSLSYSCWQWLLPFLKYAATGKPPVQLVQLCPVVGLSQNCLCVAQDSPWLLLTEATHWSPCPKLTKPCLGDLIQSHKSFIFVFSQVLSNDKPDFLTFFLPCPPLLVTRIDQGLKVFFVSYF